MVNILIGIRNRSGGRLSALRNGLGLAVQVSSAPPASSHMPEERRNGIQVDFLADSVHHSVNPESALPNMTKQDGLTIMKAFALIAFKAIVIAAVAAAVGLALNATASKPLALIYIPPKHLDLAGVRVPLIDEKEAMNQYGTEDTIFVDTREAEVYGEGHVKGALLLPADQKEERFPAVQPLLPEESRLILYCYGPECEMAEKVGLFLAQLGYKQMMIMSAGFQKWKGAGYPVGEAADRGDK